MRVETNHILILNMILCVYMIVNITTNSKSKPSLPLVSLHQRQWALKKESNSKTSVCVRMCVFEYVMVIQTNNLSACYYGVITKVGFATGEILHVHAHYTHICYYCEMSFHGVGCDITRIWYIVLGLDTQIESISSSWLKADKRRRHLVHKEITTVFVSLHVNNKYWSYTVPYYLLVWFTIITIIIDALTSCSLIFALLLMHRYLSEYFTLLSATTHSVECPRGIVTSNLPVYRR